MHRGKSFTISELLIGGGVKGRGGRWVRQGRVQMMKEEGGQSYASHVLTCVWCQNKVHS